MSSLPTMADTKIMVEFDGNIHKIVKAIEVKNRKFSAVKPKFKIPKTTLTRDKSNVIFRWTGGEIEIEDPRIIRAPLSKNGKGHESIIVREKGTYIVTIPNKTKNIDNLSLYFPKTQSTVSVNK